MIGLYLINLSRRLDDLIAPIITSHRRADNDMATAFAFREKKKEINKQMENYFMFG